MFKNDGTLYILKLIASSNNNMLHSRIVNTLCEPITFQVGECGFFKSLMNDGVWHTIITTAITEIEMPNEYEKIIVHTQNSVYEFQKADQEKALIMAGMEDCHDEMD